MMYVCVLEAGDRGQKRELTKASGIHVVTAVGTGGRRGGRERSGRGHEVVCPQCIRLED